MEHTLYEDSRFKDTFEEVDNIIIIRQYEKDREIECMAAFSIESDHIIAIAKWLKNN